MGAGLCPCLTPTHFCSPFTQLQGSLDRLQGSPVPSESCFCFPRMTTLPPGLTFFSVASHTATIPMAKDNRRNSSTWGFPLPGHPSLHILCLLEEAVDQQTDLGGRLAMQTCCLLLILQGIWTWGLQGFPSSGLCFL